jgi:hypothetical protein
MTNLEKDLEGNGGDLTAGIAHSATGWMTSDITIKILVVKTLTGVS